MFEEVCGLMSFADLGLGPKILKALDDVGYSEPTPIQAAAIPQLLQGRDVLGCAQTGTGKTASFTLPMIEILASGRARARMPRSLILAPTRELAAQVEDNFVKYGKYHRLSTALLVGGESVIEQKKILNRGVHVLIATPGRLMDLQERGNVMLNDIKVLVLDECDRMLDMGFIPDIEKIVSMLPNKRQTVMFSATLPKEIRRLADQFLDFPKEVRVAAPASTASTVIESVVGAEIKQKREILRHLLRNEDVTNAFIFCNRKRDINTLLNSLIRHGFNAGAMHGDMPQSQRTETLSQFKDNQINLLVCSDVAARGLDVQGLSHVFNFDVPQNAEDYVHRIGRTGRAGKEGRAFTFVTQEEAGSLVAIFKLTGAEIPFFEIEDLDLPEIDLSEDGVNAKKKRGRGKSGKTKSHKSSVTAPVKAKREKPKRDKSGPADSDQPRERGNRRKKRYDYDDGPGEAVLGFGDDMPAFFKNSV